MSTLQLSGVSKKFGTHTTIPGIDLTVEDGQFCVFVGPSGCGKSTLLRVIAGLEEATSGEILIDGEVVNEIEPIKRGTAMVFQSYALYPHMSVRKNIAFGLSLARVPKPEIARKVDEVAETLQLVPLLDRLPKELSGGQRQRVAIGRALVREPKLFLFDEPLSNLDASLRVHMRSEISRLHERLGTTMIYVTHDQIEAMTLADKIVVLNAGRIEQAGAPLELYHSPANKFVANFIGSPNMNFIQLANTGSGELLPQGSDIRGGPLQNQENQARFAKGGYELGIRPEHLQIGEFGDIILEAKTDLVEHLGNEVIVHCLLSDNQKLIVRKPDDVSIGRGEIIRLGADASRMHFFAPSKETGGGSAPRLDI